MKTCDRCGSQVHTFSDGQIMPHVCETRPHLMSPPRIAEEIVEGVEAVQKVGVACEVPKHFTMENPLTGEQELIPIAPPVPRRVMAIGTNRDGLKTPERDEVRYRMRKLLNPDIKEAELGPKMALEFQPDFASDMATQTDLLKQIRDIMLEGAKEARERVFTEAAVRVMDEDIEAQNRDKGIIKPSEIIVNIDDVKGAIDSIREGRFNEVVNWLQARNRSAAPDETHRESEKAGNGVKHQSQP